MTKIIQNKVHRYIYYICLAVSVILLCTSFLLPPRGEIHPSCLQAGALLLGFATLAIVGKNLDDGKEVTYRHGETEVAIGDNDNEE